MGAYLGVAAPSGLSKDASKSQRTGKDETTTGDTAGVSMTGGVTGLTGGGGATTGGTGATTGDKCAAAATAGTTPAKTPVAATDDESDYEDYSLCGYQDYDDEITEDDNPIRIRESLLKPEERGRFQALLDRIFSKEIAIDGRKITFPCKDIRDVMQGVAPYFQSEPMLIEDLPYDIVVVGDIHGQLYDLERIFSHFAKDGKPGWECRKFLFLGDYVDRGRQQLEVVMGLFCIKMLFPDNIFLLRGNHEFLATNVDHGFAKEIHKRYSHEETAKMLYYGINSVFCWMSIAAIVGGNGYLCVHAGISPIGYTRENLLSLSKPVYESDEDHLIHDTVWADPAENFEGTCMNPDRHTSHLLGVDTLVTALEAMDCQVLIRGHSVVQKGFHNMLNLVLNVFSATGAANKNDAAVCDIDATGSVGFVQFPYSKERAAFEAEARANEGYYGPAEEDEKTVVDARADAFA